MNPKRKKVPHLNDFIAWEQLNRLIHYADSVKIFKDFEINKLPKRKLPVEILFPDKTRKFGNILNMGSTAITASENEDLLYFEVNGSTVKQKVRESSGLTFRISKEAQLLIKRMKKIGWLYE